MIRKSCNIMCKTSDTAYRFYNLGIGVIPVRFGDKKPDIAAWKEFQTSLPTPLELLTWFDTEQRNIGIVTGWRGLTVLDFDRMDIYGRWMLWAKRDRLSTASMVARTAYRVSTSRGVHVYIYLPHTEHNRHMDGIDIKAAGGYVLGEGSVHPTGAIYTALTPGVFIPSVESLSDILPASILLTQDTPGIQTPKPLRSAPSANTDPWAVAAAATPITTGMVERIRNSLRVESFFPNAITTSYDGRWRMTQCPLHDDQNPSFWLDTERQICGCHAGCTSRPLDVINLYARLYGLSNRDAILALARMV